SPVRDRIVVSSMDEAGLRLHEDLLCAVDIADRSTVRDLLRVANQGVEEHRFTERFLEAEWWDVVDAWQLSSWDEYRSVARLGRKTRISEKQRSVLWSIFQSVRDELSQRGLVTLASAFARVTRELKTRATKPFDCVVVDEAQDVGVPQLRLLAAVAGGRLVSTYAGAHGFSGPTTARRTRFAAKLIDCSLSRWRTWTATQNR